MARILIVEDDKALSDAYEETLTHAGHNPIVCSDGLDALRKLEDERFDLIITDLQMNKLSGQKLIEILIERKRTLPCPILISSGFISDAIIHSFGQNEFIHFLPKPASLQQLKNKVQELLNKTGPKSKFDVRFINPILNATIETISTMTGLEVSHEKPYIKKTDELSGDISGVVGVVGSGFKGTVSLSFSESVFLIIVSKMLGEDIKSIDEENKDAVAELLNIIFGKAKKILNEGDLNIQPAIPTIVRGKDHSIAHRFQNKTIVLIFKCVNAGDFRIEISYMS